MEGFRTFEKQDRVLLALSGGVDSSVACAVLMQMGFEVEAAVIRFSPAHDGAVAAARTAAQQLGVPLHVLEGEAAFKESVIEPFCAGYCGGETPNPCIQCNPAVKFRLLAQKADELGCAFLATGHYARVEQDADGVTRIHTAESGARDQTYMLYRLGEDILERLCLPLGEFEKEDVREMARDMGLSCADAPDSMEICFIPDGDHAAYIENAGYAPKTGRFIGPDGQDLGPHKGVQHYTVGQRKGLGLALGKPCFVKGILPSGDVQLGWAGEEFFTRLTLRDIASPGPLPAGEYLVKVRSAAQAVPARFDGTNTLTFPEPVRAPAPGQSAVFYRDGAVWGGGFIVEAQ